jgi:hypothetical protein
MGVYFVDGRGMLVRRPTDAADELRPLERR